jgi:NTP pyrophosphatase (non-canonical NTP hydrolase)
MSDVELSEEAQELLDSIKDSRTQDKDEFLQDVIGQFADHCGIPAGETMMLMAGCWKRFALIEKLEEYIKKCERDADKSEKYARQHDDHRADSGFADSQAMRCVAAQLKEILKDA